MTARVPALLLASLRVGRAAERIARELAAAPPR
jgi:hypothetical protein